MRYLPNGSQMKAADTDTIQRIGIPSPVLMERAALKVAECMEQEGIDTAKALAVCGSGNNGGDGFAVARLLYEKGKQCDVLFVGKESSLSDECRLQKQIAENIGIRVFTDLPQAEYTVIIDAVFGVGLSRNIEGRYLDVIRFMNRCKGAKVAVDIPSGICAATGRVLGEAFEAQLTVGMACVKLGCELFPGKKYAGRTVAVPIGIDPAFFQGEEKVCFTYDKEELGSLLPERKADSHKGTYGKALMITGGDGMAGASYLSARAAYSVGAGMVRIYTGEENRPILQQLLPEAILTCRGSNQSAAFEEEFDRLLDWADVICIGCGLGTDEKAERLVTYTLKSAKTPCVVDADGLNLLSRHMELLHETKCPVILTPHMKEMERLTGIPVKELKEHRVNAAAEFTEKYPATCVLKDSRTLVAEKGRRTFVNSAGNSAMAKAGSGDVLAGVVTGLLAQGLSPFDAAAAGVFLHACGGDEARAEKGAYSVLAGDLIAGIEKSIKRSFDR